MYSAADGFLPIISCFLPHVVFLYRKMNPIASGTTMNSPQLRDVLGITESIHVACSEFTDMIGIIAPEPVCHCGKYAAFVNSDNP
jgi:hypothetical protein